MNLNELKRQLDNAGGDIKVKSIIDYTENSIIVVYESGDTIPGIMFQINKKTGETTPFRIADDLIGFSKAAKNRAITFT